MVLSYCYKCHVDVWSLVIAMNVVLKYGPELLS